jgi:hypothetical protein
VPQVSADIHLPLPPERAATIAHHVHPRPARPPWVNPTGLGWRFRPEDDGTQVVLWATYAVQPAWVRPIVHEFNQWFLARQLRRRLDDVVDRMHPIGEA